MAIIVSTHQEERRAATIRSFPPPPGARRARRARRRAGQPGTVVSEQADQGADRCARRRHPGRADARHRRCGARQPRHADHRQPLRRGRPDRRRCGEDRGARRPHLAARDGRDDDDVPECVQEAQLRPGEGLRADRQRGQLRARDGHPQGGPRDQPERIRRLGQDPGPNARRSASRRTAPARRRTFSAKC